MIPNTVHFVFFNHPASERPFALYHFLAVESALQRLQPDRVRLYVKNAPFGPLWDRLQGRIDLVMVDPPTEIFGRPLRHFAHQADVFRLDVLIEQGGIYLDVDTIARKKFESLLTHKCVMGLQNDPNGEVGLCNAVILSEPAHPFLIAWRDSYRSFRSSGRDEFWDEHSVRMPLRLAGIGRDGDRRNIRADIEVLPPSAFFAAAHWRYGLKRLFERAEPFDESFCHHLWESLSADRYLDRLTPEIIRSVDTTYNLLARPLLDIR